jgi:hypothetical protein
MPFRTRTSVIFTCPQCGTENDVGISPNYGSIAKCNKTMCAGQEAFTGFPQILTSPQEPEAATKAETRQGFPSRLLAAISRSYVNILIGILLNLISAALISVVAYYAVRSAIEKQVPTIIQQENQKTATPTR